MSADSPNPAPRPREVTFGGMQAIIGSSIALLGVISVAEQLDTSTVQDALAELSDDPRVASLDLTVEGIRSWLRYTLMALGVMSVTSLIMGIFVLRRHKASRIVLTVLGGVVVLGSLAGGPTGWLVAAYVGVSLFMLWTKPARAWFAGATWSAGGPGGAAPGSPPPGSPPPPDPPPPPPPPPTRP